MGTVIKKGLECPDCGSSDARVEYDNGSFFCFSCRKSTRKGVSVSKDVKIYNAFPQKELVHKPISLDIVKKYGVRVGVSEYDGSVSTVYYPYCDAQGVIQGWKIRELPKEFRFDGRLCGFFGQHLFPSGKFLIITEGEEDCLAVAQMLADEGKAYAVVSLPDGANKDGKLSKHVYENLEWLKGFESILLWFDTDKPGRTYAKALADELCGDVTVKTIFAPEPHKDAGDMLKAGFKGILQFFRGAAEHMPDMIVKGSAMGFDRVFKTRETGYSVPYPGLMDKLKGFRKGEVSLFCAGSGIGKTSLVNEIAYHLVNAHGLTVANIALETPIDDAAIKYYALDNNVSWAKLAYGHGLLTQEQKQTTYDKMFANDKVHFFNHNGSLKASTLLSKCNYFVKVLGVDFIILDHISMVVAGEASSDERKDIDTLMENLVRLVTTTGVGVIAVVHLKRVQGKNYNTGAQVELTDLRGSAGLEQMSWNVIGLERDQQGETKDLSKIRVLKNRVFGFTGVADTLQYQHDTGRLLPVIDDYQ
jgi:twinkle protein